MPDKLIRSVFQHYYSSLCSEIDKANSLLKLRRIYDSGQLLEVAFRAELEKNLPEWVGITRGFIVDSNVNKLSDEIDIIIYDKRYFSGLVVSENNEGNVSCISIDVVIGIISVKKKLTLPSLKDCISNIASVTSLERKIITNQLHNDIKLDGVISYRDGKPLNPIFSCIVAFENDLLYCQKKNQKVLKTPSELSAYYDKITSEDWFDNLTADIIYTVDGTIFYPLKLSGDKWDKSFDLNLLSKPKKTIRPFIDNNVVHADSELCLAYSGDLENPEQALGLFTSYIQFYCAQIIKSSPNLHAWFNQLDIEVPMVARHADDMKRS